MVEYDYRVVEALVEGGLLVLKLMSVHLMIGWQRDTPLTPLYCSSCLFLHGSLLHHSGKTSQLCTKDHLKS